MEAVLSAFFAFLFTTVLAVLGYFTMTVGWGLEVKSWPMLILGWTLTAIFTAVSATRQTK